MKLQQVTSGAGYRDARSGWCKKFEQIL